MSHLYYVPQRNKGRFLSVWVSSVPQLPGHTATIPGCPTCTPQTLCLSIPCTTVTWTHREVQLVPHKPGVWVSRVPQLPRISWVVQHPPHKPCVSCTTVTWTQCQLAPHKPSLWVSSVPQLPGHTATIPGCPTCPPQTWCLSIPCTTVTWTHREVQLVPHKPSVWVSRVTQLPGHTGKSNLSPTNLASEYPVYHSYLDTPGISCPRLSPTSLVSEHRYYKP